MRLITTIQRWYAKQKLRQATVAAAVAGAGGHLTTWPVSMPRDTIANAAQHWLATTLATVRTPRGIDTCGLALKLITTDGSRWHRLWSAQLPCFPRHDPHATYHRLDQAIRSLPLDEYPDTTHIELHLVSIGDIVAHHDQTR